MSALLDFQRYGHTIGWWPCCNLEQEFLMRIVKNQSLQPLSVSLTLSLLAPNIVSIDHAVGASIQALVKIHQYNPC
jgi:hypothetical protein